MWVAGEKIISSGEDGKQGKIRPGTQQKPTDPEGLAKRRKYEAAKTGWKSRRKEGGKTQEGNWVRT